MSAWAPTETKAQTTVPKIVVNVLIDQLRTDYLNAFMPLYGEEGFRRLLQEGRIYPQAEYPIAKPDRASASATMTQAYMLYRSEQEEREEAAKDEHHGGRSRPQIGQL